MGHLKKIVFLTFILLLIHTDVSSAEPKILFDESQGKRERKRILVIAPHPDDETISSSTVISYAVKNNLPLKIVIMTNGDLFLWGKRAIIKDVDGNGSVTFIDYGYTRQREVITALSNYGVNKNDIIFLGYPDSFLWEILNRDFNDFYLDFKSGIIFEKILSVNLLKYSPYNNTYHEKRFPSEKTLYNADYITRDLSSIIEEFSPTDIFVTHELDTHPDHRATPVFVRKAISHLTEIGNASAAKIAVHRYLVHFNYHDNVEDMGEYPDPNSPELMTRDILNKCLPVNWDKTAIGSAPTSQMPLNSEFKNLKLKAIDTCYSQMTGISIQTECDSEKYLFLHQFVKDHEEWWDWPVDYPLPFDYYDSWGIIKKGKVYYHGFYNFFRYYLYDRFKITQ